MNVVYFSILGRIIRVTDAVIEHRQRTHAKFSVSSAGPQLSSENSDYSSLQVKTVSDGIETSSEKNERDSKRQA